MSAESARSVSRVTGVDRVRALQRVLYRCAKRDQDRRFHAVYDRVARSDVLWKAWGEVRANRGAPGVDGVTIDDVVRSGVGDFLDDLAERLRAGTYRPRPLRRVQIPKPGRPGQLRPLGIPCVADRVVMAAAKTVLEPVFEADFLPSSYGFRPGLSAHHALETVRRTATWRGKMWVLDADIRSCFDEIRSRRSGRSDRAAGVRSADVKAAQGLAAGRGVRGRDRVRDRGGHPARVADLTVARQCCPARARSGVGGGGLRLGVLVKYADDLVVLCATREQAEQARELVAAVLDGLGLRLHPEKTGIAHLARGAQGFTFLGFEHRMRESWKQPGRWYLQKSPSRRAMASIRGKIRDRTDRRYARLPLEWAVEDLDRVLRGWGNYFRYGNSGRKFAQIDGYVNERLAILASAKHGLQGRNWVDRFNYEWVSQLGVDRLNGTVKPTLAYASR